MCWYQTIHPDEQDTMCCCGRLQCTAVYTVTSTWRHRCVCVCVHAHFLPCMFTDLTLLQAFLCVAHQITHTTVKCKLCLSFQGWCYWIWVSVILFVWICGFGDWLGLISDWFWNKHSDSGRILKPSVCPVINMVFNLISVFHFLCSLPGEVMYMSHVWGSSEPTPLVSPLRLLRLLHKETHPRARQNQETQFR